MVQNLTCPLGHFNRLLDEVRSCHLENSGLEFA